MWRLDRCQKSHQLRSLLSDSDKVTVQAVTEETVLILTAQTDMTQLQYVEKRLSRTPMYKIIDL